MAPELGTDPFAREQDGVPPTGSSCTVCGSDTHTAAFHSFQGNLGVQQDMPAMAVPKAADACEICGSDTHTTPQHPG